MAETQKIYASVDLELSGFDPEEDEVIEVGIVRFTLKDGAFHILETWDSLVRPSNSIRGRVLGLTGIDEAAAATAPLWSEIASKVQELLGDATIVGHGVELDCKFLRAAHIEFPEAFIDTLELAQIFLPTHHSYNLENISHHLGNTQDSAHRALADALAACQVLEKFVGIYRGLPSSAQDAIGQVASARQLSWVDLFQAAQSVAIAEPVRLTSQSEGHTRTVVQVPPYNPQTIVAIPPARKADMPWSSLATGIPAWVVAYADRERVLLEASSSGAEAYLGAFEVVSPKAVHTLLDNVLGLAPKEVLALLKVLVWQAQGTKHGILAEINWSIIGTEVKRLFVSGYSSRVPAGLAVTDYRSLADFKESRAVWVDQFDSFIEWLEQKSGIQLSWHSGLAAFRQVYNPETEFGDSSKKEAVVAGIAAIDTFFSLVLLILQRELHVALGTVALDTVNPHALTQITQAASNLQAKLSGLGFASHRDASVVKFIDILRNYFSGFVKPDSDVYWIEFSDTRCAFIRRPLALGEAFREQTKHTSQLVLQTDIPNKNLVQFLERRAGLSTPIPSVKSDKNSLHTKKTLTVVDDSAALEVSRRLAERETRGIFVFPTVEQLKSYYDTTYTKLPSKAPVAAVGIHGGANKVLRNFEHSPKGIILAAVSGLRSYAGPSLVLQKIVFVGVPVVDVTHPYTARVAMEYFSDSALYVQHMQMLLFLQVIRACNLEKALEIEFVVEQADSGVAQKLLELL